MPIFNPPSYRGDYDFVCIKCGLPIIGKLYKNVRVHDDCNAAADPLPKPISGRYAKKRKEREEEKRY